MNPNPEVDSPPGCSHDLHRIAYAKAAQHGQALKVVRGIPAHRCGGCREVFYDDDVAVTVDTYLDAPPPNEASTLIATYDALVEQGPRGGAP